MTETKKERKPRVPDAYLICTETATGDLSPLCNGPSGSDSPRHTFADTIAAKKFLRANGMEGSFIIVAVKATIEATVEMKKIVRLA